MVPFSVAAGQPRHGSGAGRSRRPVYGPIEIGLRHTVSSNQSSLHHIDGRDGLAIIERMNAQDVLGPQATNELTCGLGAQEMMAKTAIGPKDGEYFKIACVRHKVVAGD